MFATLERAGELHDVDWEEEIASIIKGADSNLERYHWVWAETRARTNDVLRRISRHFHPKDCRHVTSLMELRLSGGGRVKGMIPSHRPDGEVCVAVWTLSAPVPNEYASRLIHLGQCEEFWCRRGSMADFKADWQKS